MTVQLNGQDLDLRVLRLGPDDKLLVTVPARLRHDKMVAIGDAFAGWAGIDIGRVMIVEPAVEVAVLTGEPIEQAEPGRGPCEPLVSSA